MKRLLLAISMVCAVAPGLHAKDRALGYSRSGSTVIVARGDIGSLSFYDPRGRLVATSVGLRHPRQVVVGDSRFAVLDPIDNRLLVGDVRTRDSRILEMPGSPTAAVFSGPTLLVVLRDRSLLVKVEDRVTGSATCERDVAFIVEHGGRVYVYSRNPGGLAEFDVSTLIQKRRMDLEPFASSMVISGNKALLTYPGTGVVRTVFLDGLANSSAARVGSTPVDIVVSAGGSALSATSFAIADPASKRIWRTAGQQSLTEAVGRGFLRGVIGLGLSAPGSSDFPTGIDRVWSMGKRLLALDSSAGVLYEAVGEKSRRIATDIEAHSFAFSSESIYVWNSEKGSLDILP